MQRGSCPRLIWILGVVFWATTGRGDEAPPALAVRVDQLVDDASAGVAAPLSTDTEFLRRISLDLNGVPPTTQELREFLLDPAADKRDRVIDRLLESHLFPRHFASVLDIWLMERRVAKEVSADDWQRYLEESLKAQKPLNVLVREILTADGVDPANRTPARFYLDRAGEPNLIARDVGRIFFGRDLQCAQCHDSPLVDDYRQADYKGLFAFFEGGAFITRKEGDKEKSFYGEKSSGDVAFESVFIKGTKHVTAARVPGDVELVEPVYHPGEDYVTKPTDGAIPVPKFSRRAKLAELATNGSNRLFNENWANRLWGHMLGRGLVHPADMHHSSNPASHPEVLALLGRELAALNFDVKAFLRQIARTKVYQRAIDTPERVVEKANVATERLARLEAARPPLASSLEASQAAYEAALQKQQAAEAALVPAIDELNAARAKGAEGDKKVADAEKAVADAEAALVAKEGAMQTLAKAIESATAASKALPEDKELAAVVAKLAERAAQLTPAIEAQKKVIEEKKGLVPAAVAERATAWQAIDAVVAKVEPLRQPVRDAEKELLATRSKMMDDAAILGRHDERTKSLQEFVSLKRAEEEANAASQSLASAQTTAASARDAMADQAMAIAQTQINLATAEENKVAAEKKLVEANREKATRGEAARLLENAFAAAETVKQSSMAEAGLEPIIEFLRVKLEESRGQLGSMGEEVSQATATMTEAGAQLETARQVLRNKLAETTQKFQGAQAAKAEFESAAARAATQQATVGQVKNKLTQSWSMDFSLAALKPLTPEQMCWSLLRITGIYEQTRQAEAAELEKASPLSEEAKKDPAQVAARAMDVEKRTYEKLKGNVSAFVAYFAAAAGQPQGDFFATADQALFVANGGTINSWIGGGLSVATRMANESDLRRGAEDLYLTVLSRFPTDQESKDVVNYLESRLSEKGVATQELVWALVTSAEFRFNH